MRTALIPRARIALAAAISATILAIGICMASTPATAQAVTQSNGAYAIDLALDGLAHDVGGYRYKLTSELKQGFGGDYYVANLYVDGDLKFSYYVGDDLNEAKSNDYVLIILRNGVMFWEVEYDGDNQWFAPMTMSYPLEEALGPQRCGVDIGEYGMAKELIKVSGNTMTVRHAHYNSNGIFKYKSSRTVAYDYKYVYDSSKQRMKRDSAVATVAKNTTTWRTLAKSRTAYKSSTSSTKKFTISKGSSVQVKKVYTYDLKTRYYVKTKSGKYGWISAGSMYYQGA